jgi:hypothetical protein
MVGYILEERLETGGMVVLGAPFRDLIVAKVVAAQRASCAQRLTVVRSQTTGEEIARFHPNGSSVRIAHGQVRPRGLGVS